MKLIIANIELVSTDSDRIKTVLVYIQKAGYLFYVKSDKSWRESISILVRNNIIENVDWLVSSDDVLYNTSSPDIYLKCMEHAQCSPDKVLIVGKPEDRVGALASAGRFLEIKRIEDFTFEIIERKIERLAPPELISLLFETRWKSRLNVVVLIESGDAFYKTAYTFPKPLIRIGGKTMIERVVDNLGIDFSCSNVFYVIKAEYKTSNIEEIINTTTPKNKIVFTNSAEGTAVSALLFRKELKDDTTPLLVITADKIIKWNNEDSGGSLFFYTVNDEKIDSALVGIKGGRYESVITDSLFPLCVTNITSHSENVCSSGVHYFRKSSEFVKYADRMIASRIRVGKEFVVSYVHNEYIKDKKSVRLFVPSNVWDFQHPSGVDVYMREGLKML